MTRLLRLLVAGLIDLGAIGITAAQPGPPQCIDGQSDLVLGADPCMPTAPRHRFLYLCGHEVKVLRIG